MSQTTAVCRVLCVCATAALGVTAARVAGAERLHRRFLRREARGEARNRIALPRTIGDLRVGEDAAKKPLAVALEHVTHARNVGSVEPEPYDSHV